MNEITKVFIAIMALVLGAMCISLACGAVTEVSAAAPDSIDMAPECPCEPVTGAIWTTNEAGDVNVNIYTDVHDPMLNGGPANEGSAGLPDGFYYIQVTRPGGQVLGSSVWATNRAPINVVGGEFTAPIIIWDVVARPDGTIGYNMSPNQEYKVLISQNLWFPAECSKTDNYRINPTAITLSAFYATLVDGQVVVKWKTVMEIESLGFNLYRSTSLEGPRVQVNESMILAQGVGQIGEWNYEFVDTNVQVGVIYYWLEEVDVHGSTVYGPTFVIFGQVNNLPLILAP